MHSIPYLFKTKYFVAFSIWLLPIPPLLAQYLTKELTAIYAGENTWTNGNSDWDATLKTIPFPGTDIVKTRIKEYKDSLHLLAQQVEAIPHRNTKPSFEITEPQLLTSFSGNFPNSPPNDDCMAVSRGGKIVSVQNSNISVYGTNGQLLKTQRLRTFANTSSVLIFDPKVLYDSAADRFILVFLSGNTYSTNQIWLAFSKTNDPAENWNLYQLSGNPLQNDTWSDFPAMAISEDELFLTFNTFTDGSRNNSGFKESVIWQLDKQTGYGGKPYSPGAITYYYDIRHNDKPLFNLTPVSGGKASYGPQMYFLSNNATTTQADTLLLLVEITNKRTQNPQLLKYICNGMLSYMVPPNARQPIASHRLNTNDGRILGGFLENGQIHFVMNVLTGEGTHVRPGIYYGRISDLQGKRQVNCQPLSDSLDIAFPSICFAGENTTDNSVYITYLHSSSTSYPGYSVVYIDKDGKQSAPLRIKAGEDNLGAWGDYTSIVRDPVAEGKAWTVGSYGFKTGAAGGGEMASWIARISAPTIVGREEDQQKINLKAFPNPSNGRFTLDFSLQATQFVSIYLYNNKGNKVKNLLAEIVKAGNSKFYFNTYYVSPGIYFLTVENQQGVIATKKIIITKN